jgi:7,8-dihydropterin-6-yl-methyl-4-(beta-D-ribofuranosyl)aminobenzene 5'-phosphate synthase
VRELNYLDSHSAGKTSQYFLDFGLHARGPSARFQPSRIESERLDGLILSHGHRDHYAGLAGFVAQYRERMRADLQLFVAVRKLFVKNGSACAMKSRFPGVRSTAQH